jgi:hypothetical protein
LETINQTETDLESKIFIIIRNTQHLPIVLKGPDAMQQSIFTKAAHWNYNEHPYLGDI